MHKFIKISMPETVMPYSMDIIRANYTRALATIHTWYTDANSLLVDDLAAMREVLPELEQAATDSIASADASQLKQIIKLGLLGLKALPSEVSKKYANL